MADKICNQDDDNSSGKRDSSLSLLLKAMNYSRGQSSGPNSDATKPDSSQPPHCHTNSSMSTPVAGSPAMSGDHNDSTHSNSDETNGKPYSKQGDSCALNGSSSEARNNGGGEPSNLRLADAGFSLAMLASAASSSEKDPKLANLATPSWVTAHDSSGDEQGKSKTIPTAGETQAGTSGEPSGSQKDRPSKKTPDESRRLKVAMLKTAKSLSKDPLVQLSMLRAMQQQRVVPKEVEENKKKREQALAKQLEGRKPKPVIAGKKKFHRPPPSGQSEPVPSNAVSVSEQTSSLTSRTDSFAHANQALKTIPQPSASLPVQPSPSQVLSAMQALPPSQQIPNSQLLASLLSQGPPVPQQQNLSSCSQGQKITGGQQPQALSDGLLLLQTFLATMQGPQGNQQQTSIPSLPEKEASWDLVRSLGLQQFLGQGQSLAIASTQLPESGTNHATAQPSTHFVPVETHRISSKAPEEAEPEDVGPQLVRIPCRARGMPSDHNFQTAHFVLPKEPIHGQDLVCSYPACRDTGVKFRFCLYCRIPVAKRNFRLRHTHEDLVAPKKKASLEVPATICVAAESSASGYAAAAVPQNAEPQECFAKPQPFESAPGALEEHNRRKRKKHKHSQREPSEKRRKHSKPHGSPKPKADNNSVPLTIQISSAEGAREKPREVRDAVARTSSHNKKDKTKKDKKHSKKCSTTDARKKRSKRGRTSTKDIVEATNRHESSQNNARNASPSKLAVVEDNTKSAKKESINGFSAALNLRINDQDISKKRLLLWSGLLGERPPRQDDESMSRWLMNVLAVSDLKAPLKDDLINSQGSESSSDTGAPKNNSTNDESDSSASSKGQTESSLSYTNSTKGSSEGTIDSVESECRMRDPKKRQARSTAI